MKKNKSSSERIASSFRDPSGFIYVEDGLVHRQVNQSYAKYYDQLMASLYDALVSQGLLIPHQETAKDSTEPDCYKTIKPLQIPFWSYPYEWSFSQLKDAALLTLTIQENALAHDMTLKDASAYNVQFLDGKPIFIDTLSFETYKEKPWVAYRQFCQHFLAPLVLMSKVDLALQRLLIDYVDGIPLELCAKLLPSSAKLNPSLYTHLVLHAKTQARYAGKQVKPKDLFVSKTAHLGLLHNLRSTIEKLEPVRQKTEWSNYYKQTNYSSAAARHKEKLVASYLEKCQSHLVCDLGANTGQYSRLASEKSILTISADIDPLAVEASYRQVKAKGEKYLLPLVFDLTNPSPAIGWANGERSSFYDRLNADTLIALALIHHLAISNNIPLNSIAKLFASLAPNLIIEFVPKEDSNTKRLLSSREDIFPSYTVAGFEAAFAPYFKVLEKEKITGSSRTLYLLRRLS